MYKQTTPFLSTTWNGKARPRRREDEVLATAAGLFHRHGYSATSVERVAAALGIHKGSLYHYIESKEDLLYKIVSDVQDASLRIVERAAEQDALDPRGRVALYVRQQVLYNCANSAGVAVYCRDLRRLSRRRVDGIRCGQQAYFRALVQLVQDVHDGDPALAARALMGTIIWPHASVQLGADVDPDPLAEFCVGFALRGLTGARLGADDRIAPSVPTAQPRI